MDQEDTTQADQETRLTKKQMEYLQNNDYDMEQYILHGVIPNVPEDPATKGGKPPQRTQRKVHVAGRDRCLYLGKHAKQYVKMGGRFVAVAGLRAGGRGK